MGDDNRYSMRGLLVDGFREANIILKHEELEINHHWPLPVPARCQCKLEEAKRWCGR